jgi:hypothetical protein
MKVFIYRRFSCVIKCCDSPWLTGDMSSLYRRLGDVRKPACGMSECMGESFIWGEVDNRESKFFGWSVMGVAVP